MDHTEILAFDLHRYLVAKAEAGLRTDGQVAERAGVTRQYFSHIVHGAVPHAKIQSAIAEAVGLQISDLWVRVVPAARRRRK